MAVAMHVITAENYGEATDAVRDILLMYVDMASSYLGFGHAVDVAIRFDPLKFVDAEVDAPNQYLVHLDLLRAGSAVAVLCYLYDCWCEHEEFSGPFVERCKAALKAGRFRRVPDIEKVASEALSKERLSLDDPWLDEVLEPIYKQHVLQYFAQLAACERKPQ